MDEPGWFQGKSVDMKKKSIGKRYFQVKSTIFNRTVHVFLNWSKKEYGDWLRKFDKNYEDRDHDNFMAWSQEMTSTDDGVTDWIIGVYDFNWTIQDQGSLIHEIVHTVVKIWRMNNIPFTPDNQEFLAHEIGNLYEDIAASIHNKTLKKRGK